MAGRRTAAWRAQNVARVVELRPVVLALIASRSRTSCRPGSGRRPAGSFRRWPGSRKRA